MAASSQACQCTAFHFTRVPLPAHRLRVDGFSAISRSVDDTTAFPLSISPKFEGTSHDASFSQTTYGYLATRLNLGDEVMSRITSHYPSILGLSVERNIRPKLAWLAKALHLRAPQILEMIKLWPSIFHLNGEWNVYCPCGLPSLVHFVVSMHTVEALALRVQWFEDELGVSAVEFGQAALKYPAALTYNVDENLDSKVIRKTRHNMLGYDVGFKLVIMFLFHPTFHNHTQSQPNVNRSIFSALRWVAPSLK